MGTAMLLARSALGQHVTLSNAWQSRADINLRPVRPVEPASLPTPSSRRGHDDSDADQADRFGDGLTRLRHGRPPDPREALARSRITLTSWLSRDGFHDGPNETLTFDTGRYDALRYTLGLAPPLSSQ
jgi:hypothetical protein